MASHEAGYLLLAIAALLGIFSRKIFVALREAMIQTIALNARLFGRFYPERIQKFQYWFGQVVIVLWLAVLIYILTTGGLTILRH